MNTAAETRNSMPNLSDPTGDNWNWAPQTNARELIEELLLAFFANCPDAARFGERCHAETGTHISDWAGVILTPDTPETRRRLDAAGYQPRETEFVDADIHYAFSQPCAPLPDVLLTESDRMSLGIHIDSVADFFAANNIPGIAAVQGEPVARSRWARAFEGDTAALWVFERHGYDGYNLSPEPAESRIAALHHEERFRARDRAPVSTEDTDNAFDQLALAFNAAADELGPNWAADIFIAAETEHFATKHPAARLQAARQRTLGLGLANTDHLVYAASHANLGRTLDLFNILGFVARESIDLTAGDKAHVIQQPVNGHVVAIVAPATDQPSHAASCAALFGESILTAGPVGVGIRGDTKALAASLELAGPGPCKVAPTTIEEDAIAAAAASGKLDEGFAQSLRNGGVIGPVLTAVCRHDATRRLTPDSLAWRTPGS